MLTALLAWAAIAPVVPAPVAAAIPPRPVSVGVMARIAERALLVRLAPGVSAADAAALWQRAGVTPRRTPSKLGVQVVLAKDALGRSAAERVLAADRRVERVERDGLLRATAEPGETLPGVSNGAAVRRSTAESDPIPNDPRYPSEWWLSAVDVGPAWAYVGLRPSVKVAVLDTGVSFTHPDLAPVLDPGTNFVTPGQPPADDSAEGHGTHVAGTLAAATDNGAGMAGVAWGSRILPVKVLDAGGTSDDATVAQGVVWATDNGAKVLNLSLGGPAPCTFALREAVDYAWSHGVTVVAAAGNSASAVQCPANLPHVIAVGNIEQSGGRRYSSNTGPELDVVAPGTNIVSTVPLTVDPSGYASMTGTSMASPIVSGGAALVIEAAPSLAPDGVVQVLTSTATDLGVAGRDDEYGWGRIDIGAAVRASAELTAGAVMVAPTMIFADGSGQADSTTLSFTTAIPVTASVRVVPVATADGGAGSGGGATATPLRELYAGPIAAGAAGTYTWDGMDAGGSRAADGDYRLVAVLDGPGGRQQTVGSIVSLTSSLTSASVSPASFSPNGDGRLDRTTASVTLRSQATLSIEVVQPSTSTVVRSLLSGARAAGTWTVAWDGKVGAASGVPGGQIAPAGRYVVRFSATTASGTFRVLRDVTLDLAGVTPTNLASGTVFNVRDGYRDTVGLRFRLGSPASVTAYVYGAGSTTAIRTIRAGLLPAGANAITWDGYDDAGRRLKAGTYSFRLFARSPAGISRWSAHGKVVVSSRRLVSRSYQLTVRGDEYLAQSYVTDPSHGSIQPSRTYADGVRIEVDAAASPPPTATVYYAVSLPAATVPVSVDVSVTYRRAGPTVPDAGLQFAGSFVPFLHLEALEGPQGVSVPLAGYEAFLAGPAPLFVAALRLRGEGSLDLESIVLTYRYKLLQ
jgi:subtilisin family serine protease